MSGGGVGAGPISIRARSKRKRCGQGHDSFFFLLWMQFPSWKPKGNFPPNAIPPNKAFLRDHGD